MELPLGLEPTVMMARVMLVSMNSTAHTIVALPRAVCAPRGPKAVWLPMPPKAEAMSPALPLCSRMTVIKNRQTRTWTRVIRNATERSSLALFPNLVRKAGLEPACLAAPPPQDGVSASFTTSAKNDSNMHRAHSLARGPPLVLGRLGGGQHQRGKHLGVEAGGADQAAIHVGLSQQRHFVTELDAAAVEDGQGGRGVGAKDLQRAAAQKAMRPFGDLGGGDVAGAYRPNRFVGKHTTAQILGRHSPEGAFELVAQHQLNFVGLALGLGLAHADDGDQPCGQGRAHLALHGLVGFAEVLPAFGVTDDNVRTPGTRKHRARNLAGEGPLGLPMQVLTGNRDVAAA